MKEAILRAIVNLLKIKSLVTLALTGLFIYLGVKGTIPQEVLTIYTTIIAFFFGTKVGKEENTQDNIHDIQE